MELTARPEMLVVSRLDADAPWPEPPLDGTFFSVTRVDGELSIVSTGEAAPDGARVADDWRAFSLTGPLDFDLIGILASLCSPLAEAGLSVFVLSTFDTDHLLVRGSDFDRAFVVLRDAGHVIR
jgi:hypothetical protein